jgi:hypothetical protein
MIHPSDPEMRSGSAVRDGRCAGHAVARLTEAGDSYGRFARSTGVTRAAAVACADAVDITSPIALAV